jgi:hypothetical protein
MLVLDGCKYSASRTGPLTPGKWPFLYVEEGTGLAPEPFILNLKQKVRTTIIVQAVLFKNLTRQAIYM